MYQNGRKGMDLQNVFLNGSEEKSKGALLTEDAVLPRFQSGIYFVYRGVNMRNSSSRLYQGMDLLGF